MGDQGNAYRNIFFPIFIAFVSISQSIFANGNVHIKGIEPVASKPEKEIEERLLAQMAGTGNKQKIHLVTNGKAPAESPEISLWYSRSANQVLEIYGLIWFNAEPIDSFYITDIASDYPEIALEAKEVYESDENVMRHFSEKIFLRLKANPRYIKQSENLEPFFSFTKPGLSFDRELLKDSAQKPAKSDDVFSYLENLKVTTATRSETTLREAPSAVYVITAKMIRERGYRTVSQALEDIPGFQFQHVYGTFPVVVHQRGLVGNNQRSLLYIDGLPDNNISEGAMLNGSLTYPLGNVKQIEIIGGPASSLYGANAFNGIINIITKDEQENSAGGYADFTLGSWNNDFSYNAYGASFAVSRKAKFENETIGMSVSGYYLKSDGPDFRAIQGLNADQKGYWWSNNYNISHEDTYNMNARFNWNNFRAQAILWQYLAGGGTFANGIGAIDTDRNGFGGNSWDFRNTTGMMGYLHNFSKRLTIDSEMRVRHTEVLSSSHDYENATGQTSVYNSAGESQAAGHTPLNKNYARPDLGYELNERLKFDFSDKHSSTLGIEVSHFSVPTGYGSERRYKYENYAIYLQHVFKPYQSLALTAGYRFDENTNYGSAHTPRLSAVYTVSSDLTTKFLISTGFRAPTPWELFNGTSTRKESPDLKPERLTAAEIGFGYRLLKKYYINVQSYYNHITDLILEAQTNLVRQSTPNLLYWNQNQNIGNAEVLGTEIQTDLNLRRDLNVFAGYTYTASRYIDLAEEIRVKVAVKNGNAVPNLAPHTLHAGLTWYPIPDLSLHLRANYTDARTTIANNPERVIPGYFILHTTARWHNFPVRNMYTQLACRNLTDVRAFDPGIRSADGTYYPSRHPLEGRNIWLTMGITF